jgi:hypothetical protein
LVRGDAPVICRVRSCADDRAPPLLDVVPISGFFAYMLPTVDGDTVMTIQGSNFGILGTVDVNGVSLPFRALH